jgi:hypothetical protein
MKALRRHSPFAWVHQTENTLNDNILKMKQLGLITSSRRHFSGFSLEIKAILQNSKTFPEDWRDLLKRPA